MTNRLKLTLRASAATVLCLGASAFAAPTIDANIELNNDSREGSAVAAADKGLTQSGRVETNISSKMGDDLFVAGKAALINKKDGTVGTDDMWIQLGSSSMDVKLGRFEAADLFPLQGDTLVNHAGNVYGANALRGRKGSDVFHAAATFNLGSGLGFELGVISTTTTNLAASSNTRGARPVISYASGPLSARLGWELGEYNSGNKVNGFGLTVGYDFGGFKLVGNVAQGKQDAAANESQNGLGLSVSSGGFGAGIARGVTDMAGGNTTVQTGYVSYAMPLMGIKGATVTPAFSTSKATNNVANTSVEENAFRVRLNYAF